MNYERAKLYLEERGQQHLLQYYGELTEDERLVLLDDIENTNFSIIKNLNQSQKKLGKITPINAVSSEEIKRRRLQFESVGLNFLAEGKVAAVLLAGGQGSRLGYNGPKGTFNIGVTRELSIFELQMDNIKEVVSKTGRYFHLFDQPFQQRRNGCFLRKKQFLRLSARYGAFLHSGRRADMRL